MDCMRKFHIFDNIPPLTFAESQFYNSQEGTECMMGFVVHICVFCSFQEDATPWLLSLAISYQNKKKSFYRGKTYVFR